jgi:hypothetical protein
MSLSFLSNKKILVKNEDLSLWGLSREFSSSFIVEFNYHRYAELLEIVFSSGEKYVFFQISKPLYKRFCSAKSKGKFFNKHIKPKESIRLLSKTPKKG